MTTIPIITNIRSYAARYDAMLCDAWGVIHDGVGVFPGVAETMIRFRAERGPIVILTNAPRPSAVIPAQLDRIGLPREAYDSVVTSGDATRKEIEARSPAPAFRIGPTKDDPLFEGLNLKFSSLDEAEYIICTGLEDERREKPDDYRPLLQSAAARKLTMVCANPDIVVNWGGRLIWCAGALAQIYEELGGHVVFGGKPHAPIYRLAGAAIEKACGKTVPQTRILVVGDGAATDIAGANREGIDAIYVAGARGVHAGDADAESIAKRLDAAGAHAIAAMESLIW